jgi:hypothetical protein
MGYSWSIPSHRRAAEQVYEKLWRQFAFDLFPLTLSTFLKKSGFKSAPSVIAALNLLEERGMIIQEKSPYWMSDPFERIRIVAPQASVESISC